MIFGRSVVAAGLAVLAMGLLAGAASPTADFAVSPPGSPVVEQDVLFTDLSQGSPMSWSWSFGDGAVSTGQSPRHAYALPGAFTVTLTASNADGSSQKSKDIVVSPASTLRLDPGLSSSHPFEVTLSARDQRTGNTAPGQALPQNSTFGYFSLPGLTGNPGNPEVFVKVLDGTPINGQYWVFYGHLTDLIYDLTVTELSSGRTKTFHKDAGNSAGGFDVSGFQPTPTPPGLAVVNLVASNFQWDFDGGGNAITLAAGRPYRLQISRAPGTTHAFSGILKESTFGLAFGCSASSLDSPLICEFTPTSADAGRYLYFCTNAVCGTGHSDSAMQNGVITIVP